MATERMSPLDASFLHIEDHVSHMHIGSVSVFEGPPPGYDQFVAMVRAKLDLTPRFRQVVRFVPFQLGRPVWVDDPHFHLEYHIRHTALPPPGDDEDLRRLVGRVMSQQLDRGKPLWELWMVEGLEGGRWALVSKTHHAIVDGVSGTDLFSALLDADPDAATGAPRPWRPGVAPTPERLAAEALFEMAWSPLEQLRALSAAVRWPRQAAEDTADVLRGVWAYLGVARPTPRCSLNGPLGPHRRWAHAEVGVEDVKRVRKALGGTFNDVVLTMITGGLRTLLTSRGEDVDRPVRTFVPVSVRPRDERGRAVGDGTFENKVSGIVADLPVGLADPAAQLEVLSRQMAGLKESKEALAGEALTGLSGYAPPLLLALGARLGTAMAQRNINTLTTNVPGPQIPLYAAGRRMLRSYPFVPLGAQMRLTIAIFSYDGAVTFGVTGDYDAAPDIEVLTHGIEVAMHELVKVAEERTAA